MKIALGAIRNAANTIAVTLGADALLIEEGTKRYMRGLNGQPVYR